MTHTLTYRIHEVAPYINWIYFFHAWGFPPRFAAISRIHGCDACRAGWLAEFPEEERARAAEAMQLFKDANRMLAQLDGDFHTHVRFGLYPACSDGDDLLLTDPEQEGRTLRLALLRQQHTTKPDEPYLCLSDFVRPLSQGISDTVGVFAATVDADMEHLYETGAYADDFKHLLAQTLSDRLAEASTEKMHQEVRTTYWGYAKDEQWSIEDLLVEKFTGIRPAVGYPSLPDQSVNFVLSEWLGFPEIGIRLTENGAMVPHASVSGLILSHPSARYFAIGKIGEDQLNVSPSNGLQPQRLKMSSFRKVHGLDGRSSTRSACAPSRRKPRPLIWNSRAGAWHIRSTTRSRGSTPSSARRSMLTSENCTMGIPEAAFTQPPSFSTGR